MASVSCGRPDRHDPITDELATLRAAVDAVADRRYANTKNNSDASPSMKTEALTDQTADGKIIGRTMQWQLHLESFWRRYNSHCATPDMGKRPERTNPIFE